MVITEDSRGHFKGVQKPVFSRVTVFLLGQLDEEGAR